MKKIDNLIEFLKSDKPYDKAQAYKLWEVLKALSDNIIELSKTVAVNNLINTLEIPRGTINGSNKIFYLRNKPSNDFIAGYKNGLLLQKDIDFIIEDNRILMTVAPAIGNTIQFLYSVIS